MCSAVDSIDDIVNGKYQGTEKRLTREESEDTLLQLLTRVQECIQTNKTTCITEVEIRKEIETKVGTI